MDTFYWLFHLYAKVGEFRGYFAKLLVPMLLSGHVEFLDSLRKWLIDIGERGLAILNEGFEQAEVDTWVLLKRASSQLLLNVCQIVS